MDNTTIKGITGNGFAFEIDAAVADDFEVLEALVKLNDGDYVQLLKIMPMIFGEDQARRLKEHCRGENGRVSTHELFDTVKQVFEEAKELKN